MNSHFRIDKSNGTLANGKRVQGRKNKKNEINKYVDSFAPVYYFFVRTLKPTYILDVCVCVRVFVQTTVDAVLFFILPISFITFATFSSIFFPFEIDRWIIGRYMFWLSVKRKMCVWVCAKKNTEEEETQRYPRIQMQAEYMPEQINRK